MSIPETFCPCHNEKILKAMKAERTVKLVTFDRCESDPSETVYNSLPKLNENEVLVPSSLGLSFDINTAGGHANNVLEKDAAWRLLTSLF